MSTHIIAVGGFVTRRNGDVLLVCHPLRGWEFPGGMVEPGESLPQALRREIWEESGIEVTVTGFVGMTLNVQNNILNLDFRCAYQSGECATSEESLEVGWFSVEDATRLVTHPLLRHRLGRMLSTDGLVACDAFQKEPFALLECCLLPSSTTQPTHSEIGLG